MISRARGALNKMIVAVEGCCHGSLSAIYDTIHQYESNKSTKVDLLLICGDFQALRSEHDFPSLAVPPKYYSLGTFHQYYSGVKRAPLLTIVIGGNHEASNYMWELYHGGWLAENIYYLGAAGSVMVNGLRIAGASGIYKDGDYNKGRFETVPYNHSTMRSTYHTRKYDITRLMRLPRDVPTLFMSHDWPISIPHYGNVPRLLRTKPFFKQEVETNTLGSPPLLELLDTLQPEYWFAAHLHVKFAAVYPHDQKSLAPNPNSVGPGGTGRQIEPPIEQAPAVVVPVANPDEIDIDDDEFDDPPISASNPSQPANEEEIVIDMEDVSPEEAKLDLKVDESVDLVEAARKGSDPSAAENVIGVPEATVSSAAPVSAESIASNGVSSIASNGVSSIAGLAENGGVVEENGRVTKFLALDKPGGSREFIQFLEIPTPEPLEPGQQPRMTYDPYWLAIVKVYNPYLSLEIRPKVYPLQDHLDQMVKDEYERILHEGLLVPAQAASQVGQTSEGPTADSETAAVAGGETAAEVEAGMDSAEIKLVWEKGPIEINRVQKFWPTAPCQGQPGGDPRAWYTNPQTEAFCGMLGIENKINPPPK